MTVWLVLYEWGGCAATEAIALRLGEKFGFFKGQMAPIAWEVPDQPKEPA